MTLQRSFLLMFVLLGVSGALSCTPHIADATYVGSLTGTYDIMGPKGPVARGALRNLDGASSSVGLGQRDDARGKPTWVLTMGRCGFVANVDTPGKMATFVASPPAQAMASCWLAFDGLTPADRLIQIGLLQIQLGASGGDITISGSGISQSEEGRASLGFQFSGTRR